MEKCGDLMNPMKDATQTKEKVPNKRTVGEKTWPLLFYEWRFYKAEIFDKDIEAFNKININKDSIIYSKRKLERVAEFIDKIENTQVFHKLGKAIDSCLNSVKDNNVAEQLLSVNIDDSLDTVEANVGNSLWGDIDAIKSCTDDLIEFFKYGQRAQQQYKQESIYIKELVNELSKIDPALLIMASDLQEKDVVQKFSENNISKKIMMARSDVKYLAQECAKIDDY